MMGSQQGCWLFVTRRFNFNLNKKYFIIKVGINKLKEKYFVVFLRSTFVKI